MTMKRAIACCAAFLIHGNAAAAPAEFAVPPLPVVEGPIAGPGPMYSGLGPLAPGTEPADFGYLTEEYFVSGAANGRPYKTRIVVRRPEPAERFDGVVLAEVMHASGFAVAFEGARKSILLRGHAHIEIAGQQGNVDTTLKPFNPERYAALGIAPGQTSEIVAQVAILIKSNLSGGPLAPLAARRLVLQGSSQSSEVLRAYQSEQHFQARMPDGAAIFDGYLAVSPPGGAPMMVVDVPTVAMPTQTDVEAAAGSGNRYRRPDSDEPANRFRLYEAAGMPRANGRDTLAFAPGMCTLPVSDFPWGATVAMGLNRLVEWVDRGTVPPRAPYLEVDNNLSDGSRLALDENGNAKGGVRSTYVDVPVAVYGVPNAGASSAARLPCASAGWRVQYDPDTLRELYRDGASYLAALNRRLMQLVREGWVLPEYAEDMRGDAHDIVIAR